MRNQDATIVMWKKNIVNAHTQKKSVYFLYACHIQPFFLIIRRKSKQKNNTWNILLKINLSADIKLDHLRKNCVALV